MKHVICILLCLLDKTDYKKKIINKNSKHPKGHGQRCRGRRKLSSTFQRSSGCLGIKLTLYRLTGKIKSNFIHMVTPHT